MLADEDDGPGLIGYRRGKGGHRERDRDAQMQKVSARPDYLPIGQPSRL